MAAIMQFHFREHWRDLRRGRPGRRFQDRYERARQENGRSGLVKRILLILVAIVFLAISVVLTVMPGPAFVFFILAGALFAAESKTVARFMDWAEVRVRNLVGWARQRWLRLPNVSRVGVITIAVVCAAVVAFAGYRIVYG